MELSKENLTKQERKALKARRKAEKNLPRVLKEPQESFLDKDNPIITVLCVRFGDKYGIDYVEKLRNMVSRQLTVPYRFVCLTDDPTPIKGVELIVQKHAGYAKGWWHKVHMFDPSLPLNGRILYMDLDVVICNNINKIATYLPDSFLGIRDFNRKFHSNWKRLNSSVMAWNHGTQSHIWNDFKSNPNQAQRLHGDQDWIWKTSNDRLKFFPDLWIQSYKWEIRSREELIMHRGKRYFKDKKDNINVNSECSIAVFHGEPNPCLVQDKFVIDNWK